MKRKSLLFMLLFALLAPWAANAQTRETQTFDFEDQTIPTTWTNDATYPWEVTSARNHTEGGTYSIKSTNEGVNSSTSSIQATFTFAGDGTISFNCLASCESPSSYWDYGIFYIDGTQMDRFLNVTDWVSKSYNVELGSHTFKWTFTKDSSAQGNDDCFYVDDIVVDLGVAPTCPKPTLGQAEYITEEGASFQWTENGSATQWVLEYSTDANFTNPTQINRNGIPAYAITGLNSATTYYVHVKSVCGANDESDWSNTVVFRTLCEAYGLPYAYGFEDAGDLECWTVSGSTSTSTGIASADDAPEGSKVFRFHYSERNAYLISPVFDGTSAGLSVTFQYMNSSTSTSYTEQFQVGYTTSATETDPTAFTYGETIYGQNEWVLYENVFPANTKRIAIKYIYTDGMYLRLDDFNFEVPSDCTKPSGLALTASGNTFTATWNGTADTYNIDINGTVTNNVTSPYTFTGEFATTYTVMVQSNCGGETSTWTNPQTVTTDMCAPENMCELTFKLTDSYGDGWNGAYIAVVDVATGIELAQMSADSHGGGGVSSTDTKTLAVCDGRAINFVWHSGNFDSETSYVVYDVNGEVIFSGAAGSGMLTDYTVDCTVSNCVTPVELAANDITFNSANITWDAKGDTFELWWREDPSCGFEDGTLNGWTTIDADGDGFNWTLHAPDPTYPGDLGHDDSQYYISSQSYDFDAGALTPDNYFVSPQITLGGSISFWACAQDPNYPDEHFGVAVSTTSNTDASAFTTIQEWTMTAKGSREITGNRLTRSRSNRAGNWYKYTVDLSAYSGQGYVAIRHFDCTDKFYLNIDDINIIEPGQEASWNKVNPATNPYALAGLSPATSYEVQVRVVCDEGEYSNWAYTTFTTLSNCVAPTELESVPMPETATLSWEGGQESYNLRYREAGGDVNWDSFTQVGSDETATSEWTEYTFDLSAYAGQQGHIAIRHYNITDMFMLDVDDITYDGTTYDFENGLPTGWMLVDKDGDGYNWVLGSACDGIYLSGGNLSGAGYNSSADLIVSGSYSNMSGVGALNPDNWIILPYGNLGGTLSFYAKGQDSDYSDEVFGVFVTTQEISEHEWIVLEGVTNPFELTHLASETTYEWQVQGICSDGITDWSESATFTTPDYCDVPVDLKATDVTDEGATLSWTGYQSSFDLRYREAMQIDLFFYEDFSGESIAFSGENLGSTNNDMGYASGWYGFNDGSAAWIFFPDTELEGSQYVISDEMYPVYEGTILEFGAASTGEGNTFRVGFSSTDNEIESFTWSDPIDVPNDYIDLEVPEGTKYFAIEYPETSTSGYTYFMDFIVYANYVAPGDWVVVEDAANPYEVTGLSAGVEYEWQVMGLDCDGNGTDTDWSESDYFTTTTGEIIQEIELSEGWNWVSFYVETEDQDPIALLDMLKEALRENGLNIESAEYTTSFDGEEWFGDLDDEGIYPEEMYLIEVSNDCTIVLEGSPVDPSDHEITIESGYNWIGFPCSVETEVVVALADFDAEVDDEIEGAEGMTYYDGEEWFGDIETLVPGQGYTYYSASDETKPLIFQSAAKSRHANTMTAKLTKKFGKSTRSIGFKTIKGFDNQVKKQVRK